MKEAIKQILLSGGSIGFDMKQSINDWYGTIRIYPLKSFWKPEAKLTFYVEPYYEEFENIDEAVDFFIKEAFTSKNKAYIQNRLREKIDFEKGFDFEKPTKELIKLFRDEGKLVDKEFKEKFGNL